MVSGIANLVVPAIHGDLRGNDGGAAVVAIIDDLDQVAALLGRELDHRPIVNQQHAGPGKAGQRACLASVQARHCEFVEQTREPLVKHREPVARRPIAERATNPTFADSGSPYQENVEVASV